VQIALPRLFPRPRSRVLAKRRTIISFWGAPRNFLARWRISALSWIAPVTVVLTPETIAPAPGTPHYSLRDRRPYKRSPPRHDASIA
jgi:hypothetical protein